MIDNITLEKDGFISQDNNDYFGFIIKKSSQGQNHTGFFFKNSLKNDVVYLLHQGETLLTGEVTNADKQKYSYTWFRKLRPARAKPISTKLALLSERVSNDSNYCTPYGFIFSGKSVFNDNNDFVPEVFGDSLTCSTFLLCLLEGAGIFLIDKDSWGKPSEEDINWKYDLINSFMAYIYSKDFIQAQISQVENYSRYKPEEVVGSSFLYQLAKNPATFDEVQPAAAKILSELERLAS